MSKSAKPTTAVPEPVVPFEDALQKLESIVETMEAGDLPLEQLLAKFEEGAQLARACQAQLSAAEIRVQQLEKTLGGDLLTRPVDLSVADEGS